MSDWQSIETAPQERGLYILAWGPECGIRMVHWAVAEPFGAGAEWTTPSEGPGYSTGFEPGELTHWQPMPAPPTT